MYVLKQGLSKFLLENPSAAPITVEVHIGDDEIIDNEVLITGTIAGDVKIINSDTVGQTSIKVDDDASQVLITHCRDHLNNIFGDCRELREFSSQWGYHLSRAPLNNLSGCSFASVTNATTTIVSAASNVNGIILHHAYCIAKTTGAATLKVNGNDLIQAYGYYNSTNGSYVTDNIRVENIFIPAGWSLSAVSTSSDTSCNVFYKVL